MSRFLGRNKTAVRRISRSSTSMLNFSGSTNGGTSNDDAAGTDISSTDYVRKSRLLMELSKDLHKLGAGSLIDLPRIVVIGSQSAGKSSLVEAVSGINVPRDAGTCTRCPVDLWMSRSAKSWSCRISLECDSGDVTPTLRSFGPTLTDKSSVDIWLRRAQAAILSPHLSPDNFLNKTVDELRDAVRVDMEMLKFSKNRVCIEIKDPAAADLHFVDLPGLIQNESDQLIGLVKGLVESNIKPCNTVVVIAIPMSDDIENTQAIKLAREADPDGERTIGVLTKPDTVPSGSINARRMWKDVLQGNAYQTTHGYYCVRLPDDEDRERGITRQESERQAEKFFNETSPWSEFDNRSRFGVPNFVMDISKLLIQLIEASLPKLKEDVDRLLSKCNDELAELPAPVTAHHAAELLNRITAFCEGLKGAVFGTKTKNLAILNRARYKQFKAEIRATAPDFRPSEFPQEIEQPDIIDPPPDRVPTLGLLEVRDVISKSIGWELPGYVPFEATKTLIMRFILLWKEPAESCFDDITVYLTDSVESFVKSNFSRFKLLENLITSLIQPELEEYKQTALQSMKDTLQREEWIFTQNEHYFTSMKGEWLANYKQDMSPVEYATALTRRLEEEYKPELEVMAAVRAYFQVSYKRVIDHIPLAIEQELNQAFVNQLQNTLFQKLISSPDAPTAERLEELMGEDPAIAERRNSLEETRTRLLEIKRRLERFKD